MSRKLPKIITQGQGAYQRETLPRGFHVQNDPRPLSPSRVALPDGKEVEIKQHVRPSLFVRNGYTAAICDGEAHSNAFIDNCGCCAPMWGVMAVANKPGIDK